MRNVFKPEHEMRISPCSDEFRNNVEVVNEIMTVGMWGFAQVMATVEVARNLDRIATALEKQSKGPEPAPRPLRWHGRGGYIGGGGLVWHQVGWWNFGLRRRIRNEQR